MTGRGIWADYIYNSFKEDFSGVKIIIERPQPRLEILRKRLKKLGPVTVLGQNLFNLCAKPYLRLASRKRISQIAREYDFNASRIAAADRIDVPLVNSDETIAYLQRLGPDVVVVYGSRIIEERVLRCISAPFINMHTGLTPAYRGLNATYWALVKSGVSASGVTVHMVDRGLDTGAILEQKQTSPSAEDSFFTYDWFQLGEGLPLLKKAVKDLLAGTARVKPPLLDGSGVCSDPTLREYLWHRIFNHKK